MQWKQENNVLIFVNFITSASAYCWCSVKQGLYTADIFFHTSGACSLSIMVKMNTLLVTN